MYYTKESRGDLNFVFHLVCDRFNTFIKHVCFPNNTMRVDLHTDVLLSVSATTKMKQAMRVTCIQLSQFLFQTGDLSSALFCVWLLRVLCYVTVRIF